VTRGLLTGRVLRAFFGVVVSGIFLAETLSRVDLGAVGAALGRVQPAALALAVVLVLGELAIRAVRWRVLLRPIQEIPFRTSLAYLSIGYFANSLLPARLGDVARAFLAGRAFGMPRVTVLGTILVERLADGASILAIVAFLGLIYPTGGVMASAALWLVAIAAIGSLGLLATLIYVRGAGGGRVRATLRPILGRLLHGTVALRSAGGTIWTLALTLVAFGVAVAMFDVVASAAGIELSPAQAAFAMGGVALSTSVPAAPGSIGTYEFVGTAILVSFGVPRESAFVTVVLVHLLATLPTALAGLAAMWRLHFRVSEIGDDASLEQLAADPAP
jgi:uncharacterized membrane protein YbhN (UPF0104 family)